MNLLVVVDSRRVKSCIAVVIAAGALNAALAIGIAWNLSQILASAFQNRTSFLSEALQLMLVVALGVSRGIMAWLGESAGHAGARDVITKLRSQLLESLAARGPAALSGQRSGAVAVAATTGLDGLDTYFAHYLPQLVLAAIVPTMVVIFLFLEDTISALIVLLTVPLIPIFMWLIGSATQRQTDRRWRQYQQFGAYFLDVIQGMTTLRIFGRAGDQVERVRDMTDALRKTTMGTLYIAFLSALVLESLASLSTALVAAAIGVRLVNGDMTLQLGFAVLILVPEAYMPLRQLGTYFHSSKEGLSAAETVLAICNGPGLTSCPESSLQVLGTAVQISRMSRVECAGVTFVYRDRAAGLTEPVSFSVGSGDTALIAGPSGAGKTTLLGLLVAFHRPTTGSITIDDLDLTTVNIDQWRSQIGWVPQTPSLFAGSVWDNIRLGAPDVDQSSADELVRRLFPDCGLTLSTRLTSDGSGISGGERTRIAIARAVLRNPALLLLDEPTSFLDPESTDIVLKLLAEISAKTAMIISTHDPLLFPWARETISIRGAQ